MLNLIFKPHRSSLKAATDEPQKIFAMLKLIPDQEVAKTRPPLAFALVVDTSGSMREFADQDKAKQEIANKGLKSQQQDLDGSNYQAVHLTLPTKLDQAIEAAHSLIDDDRLNADDRVTIIHFDDNAKTLLSLTPISNKPAAHAAVESLRDYSGGTHMAKGMRNAHEQLKALPATVAKRTLLLTDGKTFDEPECRQLAKQFAETNSPLICIGIGEEYNEDLMRELADASQGRPYHLQNMSQLREILEVEVGSSVKEVVTDLQATVATVKGVKLDGITRVYPSLSEVNVEESPYRLGNIAAGDYTIFIFEFTMSGIPRPASRARLTQIGLSGHAPALGRRDEFPLQDLFVNFTEDEAAIAAVDPEVLGYVQQKNVDRIVQDAVRLSTIDAGKARQTLQVARGMTQRLGNSNMTRMLDTALDELDQSGTISAGTRKTVALGGRTRTVKTGEVSPMEGIPSEDEIRKLTGA
jgi:Ca-activated chloride channel family protein